MIYLIGGPPRCGKTTAAKLLAKKTKISFLPADYIASVVMRLTSPKDFPKKFPLTHFRRTKRGGNDALYAKHSAADIIRMYKIGAQSVQSALKIIIEYAAMESQDFILEGYEITPAFVHKLKRGKYGKKIKAVFLYKEKPNQIFKHITSKEPKHDWVALNTKSPEAFSQIADMISRYGKHVHKEASKYRLPNVNTDTDFLHKVRKANSLVLR